ncbi:MAG: hypothetical protein HGJ93_02990 [Desulfosarcina sp.]|nr:hypothetical protein [Desulfosarcina sp.]MBC2764939.1 hypothetical protein [Desulfosarcina sp.]
MIADIAPQSKSTGSSTMLHTLTLAFAVLTLFFALLSVVLGNRLSTLQTVSLNADKEPARSEVASIQKMETALKTATVKLEATQQALDAEKTDAGQLRRQLSVVMKDLDKAKADFTRVNQTLTKLKSKVPAKPAPFVEAPEPVTTPVTTSSEESVLSAEPPPQPAQQQTNPPVPVPPAQAQEPSEIPAVNAPEPPDVEPEKQVDATPSPATAPPPSNSGPTVIEETITDTPKVPPTAVPAAE